MDKTSHIKKRVRCQGINKKGKRCKCSSKNDGTFCERHRWSSFKVNGYSSKPSCKPSSLKSLCFDIIKGQTVITQCVTEETVKYDPKIERINMMKKRHIKQGLIAKSIVPKLVCSFNSFHPYPLVPVEILLNRSEYCADYNEQINYRIEYTRYSSMVGI